MYRHMKLSDAVVKSANAIDGVKKLRDGNGLYLHVIGSGKYWRYDYRFSGKRRTLTIGPYPSITLRAARIALFAAKDKLQQGIDPSYDKQVRKGVGTDNGFEVVAKEFLARQQWSDKHMETNVLRLEKDVYPKIGNTSVLALSAPDFLHILRIIESRGSIETAHRVLSLCGQIMRYAVSSGRITSDPTRDLKGALMPSKKGRFPAITNPGEFGKLLKAINTYDRYSAIKHALRCAPYLCLRPSELRGLERSEIDLDSKKIIIPAERMKRKREHIVPLSDSVIDILKQALSDSYHHVLVFPSIRNNGKAISDGTLNAALSYVGISSKDHVPHGFRSSFSTMAYESQLFSEDAIELQLAHDDKNKVKGAYNRSVLLDERVRLMDWWSNEIDAMRLLSAD